MPLRDLVSVREALGPVAELDLTAWDLVSAHFVLGEEVAGQVHRHLKAKLAGLTGESLAREVRLARLCRMETVSRTRSEDLHALVRPMLRVYLDCLGEWTEGAQLGRFAREELGGASVDGVAVRAEDLAFLLQMETIGCQTGLMRLPEGSVVVWHTEEDRAHEGYSRFDRLRIATFRAEAYGPARVVSGFVYPDLLLGPAFGWVDEHYIQAVDSLYLDPETHVAGVPANVITWVCLFLAGQVSTADVVRELAPAHNGYAVASTRRQNGQILADVTEFVDDVMVQTELEEQPGASHFQVNMLSDAAMGMVPGRERVDPAIERMLRRRRRRAGRALDVIRLQRNGLTGCARLLGSRVGGVTANANPDVKAHFLGHLTAGGAVFRVGPGPAIHQSGALDPEWSSSAATD